MTKWRKVWALSPSDRRLLVAAVWYLLRAWVSIQTQSFSQLVGTLDRPGRGLGAKSADIRKVRWAVEVAARHMPFRLTCLPQGFAAAWMLIALGFRPLMYYGVAKIDGTFQSHVWVELGGKPVIGHVAASRFTVLAIFPPAPQPET